MTDIQDRIAAARREAEGLKAKIKIKKEELADADCEHNMRADVQKERSFDVGADWIILQCDNLRRRLSSLYHVPI